MEAIAPTREWQKKFQYQPPKLDQKTNAYAYRKISQVEDLRNRGDIADDQFRAAEKLHKHLLGSMGVRVQNDDDHLPLNADTEYPITYHNQKIQAARDAIGNWRTWNALICLVDETRTLTQIGKRDGVKCHKISRGVGLGIVISGLDTLAQHWGLSTSQTRPPDSI